jgi:hypothetical protein
MFLIRWGFWIAVVVMLLPTDKAQQERLMQQASNAAHWTLTYCDRNPQTCTRAGELWGVFQAKAQFAIAVAGDIVRQRMNGDARPGVAGASAPPASVAPARLAVPSLPTDQASPAAPVTLERSGSPVIVHPIKPQDRLPLYPQQRARFEG